MSRPAHEALMCLNASVQAKFQPTGVRTNAQATEPARFLTIRREMTRPRLTIFAALLGGGLATVIGVVFGVGAGEPAPAAHAALESGAALVALLAAYLVLGRVQQSARLDELFLFAALLLFGLANLSFASLPAALPMPRGIADSATWGQSGGVALGAALFTVAAFTRPRELHDRRRWTLAAAATSSASIALLGVFLLLSGEPSHPTAGRFHLLFLAVQILATAFFVAAAVGFGRRANVDALLGWFAAAAVLGAFARLNYVIAPSPHADWIAVGDVLRCGLYLMILLGVAAEIRGYWLNFAETAVLRERQRIAREIHDGLAQELAFIVGRARARREPDPGLAEIETVAERALEDSRRAISALSSSDEQTLNSALGDTLGEVAERMGVSVDLQLEEGPELDPSAREALVRIAREAFLNAVRHGAASSVRVQLTRNGRTELEIADDGSGFDPREEPGGRLCFGLASMRERTSLLGGEFSVQSKPGSGTRVRVVLP
jgi:signal transduction histidine kinase